MRRGGVYALIDRCGAFPGVVLPYPLAALLLHCSFQFGFSRIRVIVSARSSVLPAAKSKPVFFVGDQFLVAAHVTGHQDFFHGHGLRGDQFGNT